MNGEIYNRELPIEEQQEICYGRYVMRQNSYDAPDGVNMLHTFTGPCPGDFEVIYEELPNGFKYRSHVLSYLCATCKYLDENAREVVKLYG